MKVQFYFIRTKRNNHFWYVEKVLTPDNFLIYTSHEVNAKRFSTREEANKFYEDQKLEEHEFSFSVVTETRDINPVYLFNMFSLNYPHNFIDLVWPGKVMNDHLKEKFNAAYELAGSYGIFLKFWSLLDNNNREKLENWILENYNG